MTVEGSKKSGVLLNMKKINKSYSGVQVLFDVDFELKAGEINCLLGENGAGKSTLVKILSGAIADYTGEVMIEGMPVKLVSPIISKHAGIHSIQQHRDLVPTMNAVENIFLGEMIVKGKFLDSEAMKKKAVELLNLFEVNMDLTVPVRDLKVSEQGIIAICKAIASDSKMLLVDEASAPLDSRERSILYSVLTKLKNSGKGIIYITHHMEEIAEIGDVVTVLRGGRVVEILKAQGTEIHTLVNAMTGSKKFYDRQVSEVVIEADSVPVVEFKDVSSKDLEAISFKAYRGEIIGFAGLEGSSKHMIAETLYGLSPSVSGEILIRGKQVHFTHPIEAIQQGVGYLPTDRKVKGLITCRDVSENINITRINQKKMKVVSWRLMEKNVKPLVDELAIKMSSLQQLVEYLSGGNQQKVLLAKWMMADVDLLFLDGPTEGIDVGARGDIYRELNKLASQHGKTLVLFSSDIDELLTLCTRVYTMSAGRIVSEYSGETAEKTDILTDILVKHPTSSEMGGGHRHE